MLCANYAKKGNFAESPQNFAYICKNNVNLPQVYKKRPAKGRRKSHKQCILFVMMKSVLDMPEIKRNKFARVAFKHFGRIVVVQNLEETCQKAF